MTSKIKEALKTEPKKWLIYVHNGEIIVKEGIILSTENLPFTHYTFYPNDYYDKSYRYSYTQLPDKPLTFGYGKIWCNLEEDIPKAINIIKKHYSLRKDKLEDLSPLQRAINVINQGENKKDLVLKKCPFCGSNCNIIKKVVEKGSNTTGIIPNNAVLVEKEERDTVIRGIVTRYYWKREKYIPRCSNQECIISTISKGYITLAEAVKEWNKRSIK